MRLSKILLFLTVFFIVSCAHAEKKERQNYSLERCPSSPNCVVSLYPEDKSHFVEPIENFDGSITKCVNVLLSMGLEIQSSRSDYIHATDKSSFFKFVDDIEIKIIGSKIHLRSSSRVGYYDFGVNRKRLERFRSLILKD